ncbi:MAG: phospho-N-acetylmuramoyl-pentapeptide-transferase, partial [Nitrospinota bacterium]
MLYHLLYPLHEVFTAFNVFRYITFRTAYATLTSLLIALIFGPPIIRFLSSRQIKETIREDGPQSHMQKTGTPTMGGLLILLSLLLPTLLWADLTNRYIWLVLFVTFAFAFLGFADDYRKVFVNGKRGLGARNKLLAQIGVGLVVGLILYWDPINSGVSTRLAVPFFKRVQPDLGFWYVPFAALVITATSNAVNLTDGLDGLAIGPFMVATAAFIVITYAVGHAGFASYLKIPHVRGAGELTVLSGAMLGASLGFLWFNTYPAQVFMGDVGALALGGALGTVALVSKHELLLFLVGGIFVIEALSVIVQVVSFKLTGRRVLLMAPLHHHFEELG